MNKIVVIGGSGHAKSIITLLKKLNYNIIGYVDIKNSGQILGISFIGDDQILESLIYQNVNKLALGIGNIDLRNRFLKKIKKLNYEFPTIISPQSIINENIYIGQGSAIMDGVIINSDTKIGSFCIINTKASVDHDCNILESVHIAPGATVCGGVTINKNTLIGAGSTIIQNIIIGKQCIIGAGAVVTKNLSSNATYIGIPAKKKNTPICSY